MNKEHIDIVKQGTKAIEQYIAEHGPVKFDLTSADLRGEDLIGANLTGAQLVRTNLRRADLSGASLKGSTISLSYFECAGLESTNFDNAKIAASIFDCADLTKAHLFGSDIQGTKFRQCVLAKSILPHSKWDDCSFTDADLTSAGINSASTTNCDFTDADLTETDLRGTLIQRSCFERADFTRCMFGATVFVTADFRNSFNLDLAMHFGPSSVEIETLLINHRYPVRDFLKQCGIPPWLIAVTRFFDESLTPNEVAGVFYDEIFPLRTTGPLYLGSIFISYSSNDAAFATRLYNRLKTENAHVFLDAENMVAGRIEPQLAHPPDVRFVSKEEILKDVRVD